MYKFQGGGPFTFQPYQSVYEPTGQLEIAEYMRKKYDETKENRDLIDRALATFETSPGDAHLVTKATDHINELLASVDASGAYERAGAVVSEAHNFLLSDKGLMLAKRSQDMRNKELEWQAEYQMKNPGVRILGFGDETWKNHISYKVNDDGSIYENIYQPLNQVQADYANEMNTMLTRISSSVDSAGNQVGVTQENADMIGELMFNSYLGDMADNIISGEWDYGDATLTGSDVGAQDYKRLMEIDLKDKFPNMKERHEAAISDIKKRIKFATQQWVNQNAMSQNLHNHGVLPTDVTNPNLSTTRRNVSVDASNQVDAVLANDETLINQLDSSQLNEIDKQTAVSQYNQQQQLKTNYQKNALQTGFTNAGVSNESADQMIQEFNFYEGTGPGSLFEGHPELYALADFMTRDNDIFDDLSQGALPIDMGIAGSNYDWEQVMSDAQYALGAATVSTVGKKVFKKSMKGFPNFWKVLATGLGAVATKEYIDYKFKGFSNVNDFLRSDRPEGKKGVLDYLNPIKNEVDFLKLQLTGQDRINWFNDLAGTNYTNNREWKQNVDRVIALWEYRKRGGDISKANGYTGVDLQKMINQQQNVVYDVGIVVPDWTYLNRFYSEAGDKNFKTNFMAEWDQSSGTVGKSIHDFRLAGSLGKTTNWHEVLGYDESDGLAQVDVNLVGIMPADIITNTPPMYYVSVKKAGKHGDGGGYANYLVQGLDTSGEMEAHQVRETMQKLQQETLIIEDNARNIVNYMQETGTSPGGIALSQPGEIRGRDIYNALIEAYTTYNGGIINKEYAALKSRDYLIQSFKQNNRTISEKIEASYEQNPSAFIDVDGQGMTLEDVYANIIWNGSETFKIYPYIETVVR
jgi:hypothetical protein